MKRRIYTDTSVVGGCFDAEFREPSQRLFERLRSGSEVLVLSDLMLSTSLRRRFIEQTSL